MANRRLDSWKEIAAHLGRTVRTAQRYEKEGGLPVHRESCGRHERVSAFTEELDRWMESEANLRPAPPVPAGKPDGAAPPDGAGSPPEGAPQVSPSPPSINRRWILRTGAVVLATAVLMLLASRLAGREGWPGPPPGRVESIRLTGFELSALDAEKQVLWRKTFPAPLVRPESWRHPFCLPPAGRICALEDIDGDGAREILVLTGSNDVKLIPSILHCLSENGNGRWQYQAGRPLVFGATRQDGYYLARYFLLEDLDGDGRREILLNSFHHNNFPSLLTLLDSSGDRRSEYIHSGHVCFAATADLDGDGTPEILASGINNGYRKGFLAVLDSRAVEGASPQPDTPGYQCLDVSQGREHCYLLFPRDCVNEVTEPYGTAAGIQLLPDEIRIGTGFVLIPPCLRGGGLTFRLDRQFRLLGVEADAGYPAYHRCLEEQGRLDHPFSPAELDRLNPILYWDGRRFTDQPSWNPLPADR
jgi:hypothetical protein